MKVFKSTAVVAAIVVMSGVHAQNITQGAGYSGGSGATNTSSNGIAIGNASSITPTASDAPDIVIGYRASSSGATVIYGPTGLPIGGGANTVVGSFAGATNSTGGLAVGNYANVANETGALVTGGVAVGPSALVSRDHGSAFGELARATGAGATALGSGAWASGNVSIAIGNCAGTNCYIDPVTGAASQTAKPSGTGSVAIGTSSGAGGAGATALGMNATANNNNSVALGAGTTTSRDNTVAVGGRQITDVAAGTAGTDGVNVDQLNQGVASAVGQANAYTNQQLTNGTVNANFATVTTSGLTINPGGTVNMGGNRVQNVGDAVAGTDAVNLNQLNAAVTNIGNQANTYTDSKTKYFRANATGADAVASGSESVAIGPNTVTSGANAIAGGNGAVASGDDTVVFGAGSKGTATGAVAIGAGGAAGAAGAVAVGQGANAAGTAAVAMGSASVASGASSVAVGNGAQASGANSISIGTGNVVTGTSSGAIGDPSNISGNGSYALGNNNNVAQDNTFVVGNNVTTTQANSVTLGNGATDRAATTVTGATINGTAYNFAGAGSSANGVVSIGAAGAERQLINVASGELSATSTDAVNGSQLYATNTAVNRLGSNVNNLGTSTANNFGGGSTYDPSTGTVSAPSYTVNSITYNNVGGAIGALGSTITQNNSGNLPPASATGSNSVAIGAGSNASRDNSVDFGGRQLTGIAPGTQDGDASTMGQLRQATASSQGYTDRAIATLDARAQKMMSGIGAMAMASSALQPNARAEGNTSVSAAVGTYNGESAIAAGVNYYLSNQVLLNARIGVTTAGPAKVGAAVGVTWGF